MLKTDTWSRGLQSQNDPRSRYIHNAASIGSAPPASLLQAVLMFSHSPLGLINPATASSVKLIHRTAYYRNYMSC